MVEMQRGVTGWKTQMTDHPDGSRCDVVFDTTVSLLEMKWPNAEIYVDYSYLKMQSGTLKWKQSNNFYLQVSNLHITLNMVWFSFPIDWYALHLSLNTIDT